ncbi:MAG: hypothetical protein AAGA21_20850 [Pseudomonadota bacterium]
MAVLVGTPKNGVDAIFDPLAPTNASQRIVGSKLGDAFIQQDIPDLIRLYRNGPLKLDKLLIDRFPLTDIGKIMTIASSSAGLKTLIRFDNN